jgi:hypothetical protein
MLAFLVSGPLTVELGSPESPQGAEPTEQGLEVARPSERDPAAFWTGASVAAGRFRGPQQQDAPRHLVPHLQWWAVF